MTLDPSQLGGLNHHGTSSPGGGSNFRQELLNQYKREHPFEDDENEQETAFEEFARRNNNSVRILNFLGWILLNLPEVRKQKKISENKFMKPTSLKTVHS